MAKVVRSKRSWVAVLGLVLLAGAIVPLAVLGGEQDAFTATPYSDVIRFEARGVASVQVKIFDLDGRTLWNSGSVSGSIVDWGRRNDWGERLSYGAYLYSAQGWNARGDLVFTKSGRLALMPGDQVQLQQAPRVTAPESPAPERRDAQITLGPLSFNYTDLYVERTLGVGTDDPDRAVHLQDRNAVFRMDRDEDSAAFLLTRTAMGNFSDIWKTFVVGVRSAGPDEGSFFIEDLGTEVAGPGLARLTISSVGNIGIGEIFGGQDPDDYPRGALDVRNTADQPALRIESSSGENLIEAYNTGSGTTGKVFWVERASGDVHTVGSFYGKEMHAGGGADIAEHINSLRPLKPGDVVEIDPDNAQHFRLASSSGSRLVAGVISTQPGVVLGSNVDPVAGGVDTRPILALAGRVPVKATTENGPIQPGDILISSSTPGYAMRTDDPASAIGAIIGKALEPLTEGEGLIMIQVTLR